MPPYTQINRRLRIYTPLGQDVLILQGLSGHEGISTLFSFEVALFSEQGNIDFEKIVGKYVTASVQMQGGRRYFNGIVSRFSQSGTNVAATAYSAQIVPWVWFLTRTADCRIFQKQSVREILEKIFDEYKFQDFEFKLKGTYEPREYCVQYRETDYNFIARLLEEEGIYYFFRHEEEKHTLVIADDPAENKPCDKMPTVRFVYTTDEGTDEDVVLSFDKEQEVRPGQYSLTDYNFETPQTDLTATTSGGDKRQYEIYDFPGEYRKRAEGDSLTKIRQQEEDAPRTVFRGSSHNRAFTSGYQFDMTEHPNRPFNASYVLTTVSHQASESAYISGEEDTEITYTNSFECIPASVPFRPSRHTPPPKIVGVQTAVVVGPKGEEIFTDKYGRVKVRFHWDREGKADENSSCWIRVSQAWANKRWGTFFLPRIGQEVIVDFLEGDPDRPIITGAVYNAETMPPYPLPDDMTKSTMKSYSSKGGGGFNEIRFEDKKDSEQIFIHAQKDQDIRIKHDLYEWVGNESHLIVKADQIEKLEANRHTTVGSDDVIEIGKDQHLKVKGKQAIEIADSHSLTVTGDVIEVFKANHSEQTTQNLYLKAMGVVIEASTGMTLKCGGNSVVIDPAGVTIKGTLVTIDGSMVMIASGPGSPAMSGNAGNAVAPIAPQNPHEADKAEPGQMREVKPGKPNPHKPTEEDKKKKHWIEIELVDEEGKPVPGEEYAITLPDGQTVASGSLDAKGFARVEGIEDAGECKITFPKLDKEAWKRA